MQVKQYKVKNQFIITNDGTITFQSYASTIATIDNTKNTITIYKDFNYSKTTLKYFYQFIDEYANIKLDDTKNKQKQIEKLFNTTCNGFKIVYQN